MSKKCRIHGIVIASLSLYYGYMRYRYYNPNPERNDAIDCVVRAICKVTGRDWESTYLRIAMEGLLVHNMPNSNHVWGSVLRKEGFKRVGIPNTCPDCYTVIQFCEDHPRGSFILATGSHAVAAVNGLYYDIFDCGEQVVDFYWYKEA